MKRKIVIIDEKKCNGCGNCIPSCPEGAIRIIDNKAYLISDLFCDGLGACIGYCPQGAISIEEREAQPYNERAVIKNMIKKGKNVIKAHLQHLKDHNEKEYFETAIDELKKHNIEIEVGRERSVVDHEDETVCPGSRTIMLNKHKSGSIVGDGETIGSGLAHWPIQLHLISPTAHHYKNSDVLLSADCIAYAFGDFHRKFLSGKTLAIACPKLDQGKEIYIEKIRALIDESEINSLTVITMEVPCCSGLLNMARKAVLDAKRKIQIRSVVIGINGDVKEERIMDTKE